jgi:nicotinate phosphoribosyltransferase
MGVEPFFLWLEMAATQTGGSITQARRIIVARIIDAAHTEGNVSLFDGRRLTNATLKLDVEGLRRGYTSDRYFANVVHILQALDQAEYTFAGRSLRPLPPQADEIDIGNLVVEAQVFNRRAPRALVAGVDVALAMLRHATGYFDGEHYVETWAALDVEAVEDGVFTRYAGDPSDVQPVLKIRGRYRDFALLETAILGVLTRASRIATNVYDVLEAANGKPVLYFPARFDLPDVQPIDGYAYWLAVKRCNRDGGYDLAPAVSTDAQSAWWGGRGGGTIPHSLVAAFLGDTAEAMVAFAEVMPASAPRFALVDFNNDTVQESLAVLQAYWQRYRDALRQGDEEGTLRWTLHGVRLDTSSNVRDESLPDDAPTGVSIELARRVREALDSAWQHWDVSDTERAAAEAFCRGVKIVATGGFNRTKIEQFERDHAPVDLYGVGSTFLQNDQETNTDYTMDVVRVNVGGEWIEMAKVGRRPNENPDLKRVRLDEL